MFERFAKERLHRETYTPGERTEENQAFVVAEQSTRQLMGWANGLTNNRGETLNIELGYIERMTPNALADRFEGMHFIAMHQALLVSFVEFAMFAFTQAHVFPHIGNAAQEASPPLKDGLAPGIMLLEKTLRGETVENDRDHWRVPADENRHAAAIYLSMLMSRYVWLHELAHCTNGHISFAQDIGLAFRLYEVAENLSVVGFKEEEASKSALTPEQREVINRALEFDADSSAFFGSCQIQIGNQENITGIQNLDLGTRLGLTIFAAYATTWLFEEYSKHMGTKDDVSHPHPYNRLRHLTTVAIRDIAPKFSGFEPFHQSICDQFNSMAIEGLFRVGEPGMPPNQQSIQQTVQEALQSYKFYNNVKESA